MKDLDFDELDRAVNSLLTTNGAPGSDKPAEQPSVAAPTPEPAAVVADTPDTPVVPSTPLAARRSSGRFMDVVHPSSDMRSTFVPSRPVSREGMGVAPIATDTQNDTSVLDTQGQIAATPQPDASPSTYETPAPTASEWPDPLDFSGFSQDESTPATSEEAPKEEFNQLTTTPDDQDGDINQITDDINKTLGIQNEASAPLESPFLADAKVEKRPLGAFSLDSASAVAEVPQSVETPPVVEANSFIPTAPEEQKTDEKPIELVTPLPAELAEDLLSIESDTDTTGQLKKEMTPASQAPQPEATAGPVSIPQQYTEQPSTGDQPAGTIFDTGEYQKPLAHPAKKKSGWLMLLWIVLLLAVGAGAGAAVYFFILPML